MFVWKKLIIVVKGGVNEVVQLVVDSQVIRIFEQEIWEVKEELCKFDYVCIQILVKCKLLQ